MATSLSFDERNRVLMVRYEGEVTAEVLEEGCQRMRQWFAAQGYCSSICDFSDTTSFTAKTEIVRRLASKTPVVPSNYARVIVAPQDAVFGIARMFQILGSSMGNRVDVVRDIADAYPLAGVESLELKPVVGF